MPPGDTNPAGPPSLTIRLLNVTPDCVENFPGSPLLVFHWFRNAARVWSPFAFGPAQPVSMLPDWLKRKLLATRVGESRTEAMARFLFSKPDLSPVVRAQIAEGIRRGTYEGKERYVNDPEAAEVADRYFTDMIQRGLREGKIAPPKADEFMGRMRERLRG